MEGAACSACAGHWAAVAEILRRNIDIGEELLIRAVSAVNETSQDLLRVESALCFVRLRSARYPKKFLNYSQDCAKF